MPADMKALSTIHQWYPARFIYAGGGNHSVELHLASSDLAWNPKDGDSRYKHFQPSTISAP
jgi:hypothetical protein